uniref:Uncharacterized protein n=1 Tax=Caenorhabditis japonica TaxID=281687 RepID=A0A8R1IQG4_CAEJA
MRKTVILTFWLISCVACFTSTSHKLKVFNNTTFTRVPNVLAGSKLYLASFDLMVQLAKITLLSDGNTITLDKLVKRIDNDGFQIGWPISSDLFISTSNPENVTEALTGGIFLITPTMAKDPNLLVYVVRGSMTLDRSNSPNSTIVFLNLHIPNNGNPAYMGFTHTRVENIIQPKTTSISFYSGEPDDYYGDVENKNTTNKRIFANPLLIGNPQIDSPIFFENIDPIQYSLEVWVMRAVGPIKLDVSDIYVDTTSIQSNASTVTGMSNSQLFTYNSSVNFLPATENIGTSGIMVATDLFSRSNVSVTLNGNNQMSETLKFPSENVRNNISTLPWLVESIQIVPSNIISGIYFVQYFRIVSGIAPTPTPTEKASASTGFSNIASASTGFSNIASASTGFSNIATASTGSSGISASTFSASPSSAATPTPVPISTSTNSIETSSKLFPILPILIATLHFYVFV